MQHFEIEFNKGRFSPKLAFRPLITWLFPLGLERFAFTDKTINVRDSQSVFSNILRCRCHCMKRILKNMAILFRFGIDNSSLGAVRFKEFLFH